MKNNDKQIKMKRDLSSKYGANPNKFDEDIDKHKKESEQLYSDFIEFMRAKKVDARKFRALFMKYYEDFIK